MENILKVAAGDNGGPDRAKDTGSPLPSPLMDVSNLPVLEVQDAGELRSQLFSTLADVEARADRRHESLTRRIQKLENRGGLFNMPEEVKGFLVMLSLYVGVTILLPELARLVREWRQSQ